MPRHFAVATAVGVLASVALLASPCLCDPGNVTGKVVDASTKDALSFANVVVMGTNYGAMSMDDGSFFIKNIPEGVYSIKASYMGYETVQQDSVRVKAYSTVQVDFRLLKTVLKTTEEVLITARRPMVEVDVPTTVRTVSEEELKTMPVASIEDVVSLQAGVIRSDDEIHIRGGRADETLYIIDGVKMKDLISGKSSLLDFSAKSVAEMDVITGGYSAEHGQALSGIVNVKLKEGGASTEAFLEYSLDHMPFKSTDLDYWNSDKFEAGIDGPEPITTKLLPRMGLRVPGQVSYFLGVSGSATDTYLPSISDVPGASGLKSSYEDKFLWWKISYKDISPRAENKWQAYGKLTYRLSSTNKFALSFTKTIAIDQGYTRYDPYDVTRETSGYQHDWSRHLDHYLTYTEDSNSLAFSWNQILSENTFHVLRLSRFFNCIHADVAGKNWHDYQEPDDYSQLGDADTPYFVETGDADLWHDRFIETYNFGWDFTSRRPPHHQFKGGVSTSLENAQYIIIREPWVSDPDSLGLYHDIFHIYPARGAFYLEDNVNFEGLIGQFGLRYDYWFPGKQVERAIADTTVLAITSTTRDNFYRDTNEFLGRRYKGHLSPRIAISHPITDRDNLFFNYGHFTQVPNYIWIYSKLSSVSSELFPLIGNPNLNSEISVQYEIGARHQFTETVAANFTLFYKDIYDYPTSTSFEKPGVGEMFIYRNMDYARSRGIEIEVKKKINRLWGGNLVYTYSVATGKSSDPNTLKLIQEQGGDVGTSEGSLAEEYLWWNRPHKINLTLQVRMPAGEKRRLWGLKVPENWDATIQWLLQSGKPYTPTRNDEEVGKRYSANGPRDDILDLKITKYLGKQVGQGIKSKIYLQVDNVFNRRTVRTIDAETGQVPEVGKGSHVNETGSLYYIYAYSSPSMFGAPRQARLGMGIEW
jgi:outer membrane receptor protein involved in Fe transport